MKTKQNNQYHITRLLCAGMVALCASTASAVIIDDFQSYTSGTDLVGQGPWIAGFAPTISGTNITVQDIGAGAKVAQFFDNSASTLSARLQPPIASGSNTLSYTARISSVVDSADTSWFSATLNSGLGINSALDPTFTLGFGNNNTVIWLANFTALTGATANNSVTVGDWYKFDITYDFTHTQGDLNTNYANFTVTNLTTPGVLTTQSLSWANQNGGRTVLGAIDFITGSTHADSTYQLDNIAFVPEPSSFALLGVGLAGLGLVRRRRN